MKKTICHRSSSFVGLKHQCSNMDPQYLERELDKNITRLHSFATDVEPLPPGHELSRLGWVRLNRLRNDIGRFESLMYRWRLTTTAVCDCDAEQQTPEHLLCQCPIYNLARKDELLVLDDNTIDWLLNVCPNI